MALSGSSSVKPTDKLIKNRLWRARAVLSQLSHCPGLLVHGTHGSAMIYGMNVFNPNTFFYVEVIFSNFGS